MQHFFRLTFWLEQRVKSPEASGRGIWFLSTHHRQAEHMHLPVWHFPGLNPGPCFWSGNRSHGSLLLSNYSSSFPFEFLDNCCCWKLLLIGTSEWFPQMYDTYPHKVGRQYIHTGGISLYILSIICRKPKPPHLAHAYVWESFLTLKWQH